MRKFSAHHIFTGVSEPIKNGVITVDEKGTILDVSSSGRDQHTELLDGIICPGFINTHCHLELSHMRELLEAKTGMVSFIKGILSKRGVVSTEQIQQALITAEQEMINNGIVAVADISNTNNSFEQKAKGRLYYHTFIELIGPNPAVAKEIFEAGIQLKQEIEAGKQKKSTASIVPHAPYTLSVELLKLIDDYALQNVDAISIHNQESAGEN